jgi:hypothetical protein
MVEFAFQHLFLQIEKKYAAMGLLRRFAKEESRVAQAAEAIRRAVHPLRETHDRWTPDPDGASRPGTPVDRESLREGVKRSLKKRYADELFQKALNLCTVNSRARLPFFPIWQALQDLSDNLLWRGEEKRLIGYYYDLLLLWDDQSLRTAVTACDPLFRMYRDPQSGEVRLGHLVNWKKRVDWHYYLLAVYGKEPEYIDLGAGEYLYFDSPEIRD